MKSLAKTYCENDKQNSNNSSSNILVRSKPNYRQLEKTIKERCRRDKINGCIIELKNIIKDSANLPNQEFLKYGKADILELVIQHLKPQMGIFCDVSNYQNGINLCANETIKFLETFPLTNCISSSSTEDINMRQLVEKVKQSLIEMCQKNTNNIIGMTSDENQEQCSSSSNHNNNNYNNIDIDDHGDGVLLDLSKHSTQTVDSYEHGACELQQSKEPDIRSSAVIAKREILDKIRQKIFEKRRLRNISRRCPDIGDSFMWRPW